MTPAGALALTGVIFWIVAFGCYWIWEEISVGPKTDRWWSNCLVFFVALGAVCFIGSAWWAAL